MRRTGAQCSHTHGTIVRDNKRAALSQRAGQGPRKESLVFQFAPHDERKDLPAPTRTLWAGVALDKPLRRTDPLLERLQRRVFAWRRIRRAAARCSTPGVSSIFAKRLPAHTTGEQVDAVTDWITEQIQGLVVESPRAGRARSPDTSLVARTGQVVSSAPGPAAQSRRLIRPSGTSPKGAAVFAAVGDEAVTQPARTAGTKCQPPGDRAGVTRMRLPA